MILGAWLLCGQGGSGGCVVLWWWNFGSSVVVGGVRENIKYEFRQPEQKQEQEQEPIGS